MIDVQRTVGRVLGGASRLGKLVGVAVVLWPAHGAWAQSLSLVPSLALTETVTNNRDLQSVGRQSDVITQISPGLSLAARRGVFQGSLTYSLNGLVYAQKSSLNNVFHNLASQGKLDLLDGRLAVDANAMANRQVVSAFSTQSNDPALNNLNQAQVFSYGLAPRLQGVLLGNMGYQVRVAYQGSRSDAPNNTGDSASLVGSAGLTGKWGTFDWGVDASRSIYENADRPRGHQGALGGSLSYSPDVELKLQGRLGSEVDDVRTGQSERTTTWGAGLVWKPGPRTTVRLDYDHRYFGQSHLISLSHRTANTIWTYSDSRSLQTGGTVGRNEVSLYEQLFAQSASIEPDPAKRDVLVRNFLAANGLDPAGRVIVGGFLSSAPAVQRSQLLSATYQGLRSTLSVSLIQTSASSITTNTSTGDDLANGAAPRQRGLSFTLSHRLTPEASLAVTASQQRTSDSGSLPGNTLKSLVASWSTTLNPYARVSLGMRYTSFDSEAVPYQESAVFGSIRLRF